MKEAGKWILATAAVITFPVWFVPVVLGSLLYKGIKSFKEDVLDGDNGDGR